MQLVKRAEQIQQAIQAKIDAIRRAVAIDAWKYRQGAPEGAQAAGFDDRDWETVRLMRTWSSADGEAWFRLNLDLPPVVEGVPLIGTSLNLEVMLPIGAAIYVNGAEVLREPSWSDSRAVPLLLTRNYQPGAPMTVAVRCNAGDGFGLFLSAVLRFGRLDGAIFDLDLFRAQMTFTRFLAEEGPEPGPAKASAWQRAADAFDAPALARNDWDAARLSMARAREALAPFAVEAKSYTAYLVAHSHIDMNWLWPWQETVEVCRRDFAAADKLMGLYPEFRFSQSQAAAYEAIARQHPDLFARAKERIREGRWDVTASTWVEGDLNMACGEALVRQILHARRFASEQFGLEPLICWEPDTFGHTAMYPQILKQCGIRYYYFCRAGKRHPLFWWEGLDGSRVLAVQDLRGYGGENDPSDVVGAVLDFAGRAGIRQGLYVYGVGDHGGGATARDIEKAAAIDAAPFLPRARPSAAAGFYERTATDIEAAQRAPDGDAPDGDAPDGDAPDGDAPDGDAPPAAGHAPAIPVVRGELNTVFEGCYTSHGDIKRMNRESENGLLTAEALAALAAVSAGYAYPLAGMAEAWRALCFHQFHDILCGCAIGVTYREARERMDEVRRFAGRTAEEATAALGMALDVRAAGGRCIAVFNPLAWERDDVARLPLRSLGGALPAALIDDAGRRIPIQACGDEALFVATGLPSMGARIYRLADEPAADEGGARADADHLTLDNGLLRLRVNPASGALDQLIDLEHGRDIAGPWAGWGPEAKLNSGMLNRMQILWEQPHPMSAWNIGDITRVDHLITGAEARVVERGPVRAVVEVRRAFLNSTLVQRIAVYRGLRRVDFETTVDWHERGGARDDAPMLRTTFAPFLDRAQAAFEIAFAGLERAADGRETPALRWADVSEPGYGVSLLNDGKYGHQAHGNTLGLTLLRASYEPDNNPDEGLHQFTYALYPHAGDWRQAGTIRRAAELNQPALAVAMEPGGGASVGALKPGQPGLTCQSESVLVSAVKLAEDQPAEGGTAVVIRLFESHGRACDAELALAWPVARAEETDLLERAVAPLILSGGVIRLSFAAHEIKTLKAYFG